MRIQAALLILLSLLVIRSEAGAQESVRFMLGAGGGPTFYCIDTRCDDGTILGLSSGIQLTSAIAAELGGAPLELILITHHHVDQSAGVPALLRRWPEAIARAWAPVMNVLSVRIVSPLRRTSSSRTDFEI